MLTVNSRRIAEAEISQVSGAAGLGLYRLLVGVKLRLDPAPAGADMPVILDLGGTIEVQGHSGARHHLGRLHSKPSPVVLTPSDAYVAEYTVDLEAELDTGRADAIEATRLGGDLHFSVALWARVQLGLRHEVVHDTLNFRVNQSAWVEVLNQMAYTRIMLLEVPVPEQDRAPELAEAVSCLTGAQRAVLRGEYREAVGLCRDVLEALSRGVGDDCAKDPEMERLFGDARRWDKSRRLRLVRRALLYLCHPARHRDPVSVQFQWNRADAVSTVSMLAALLGLFPEMVAPTEDLHTDNSSVGSR